MSSPAMDYQPRRVVLDSPYGRLSRGHLTISNGTECWLIGRGGGGGLRLALDEKHTVVVSKVPEHWVSPAEAAGDLRWPAHRRAHDDETPLIKSLQSIAQHGDEALKQYRSGADLGHPTPIDCVAHMRDEAREAIGMTTRDRAQIREGEDG